MRCISRWTTPHTLVNSDFCFTMMICEAIRALVQARRFKPDDLGVLTPPRRTLLPHWPGERCGEYLCGNRSRSALPNDQGLALQVLGQGMLDRGLHQSAQTNFNAALAKAEAIGNDLLISDLLIDLGRVSLEKMEVEDALASFHEAESFAEAIPYPVARRYARLNQIEALIAAGRPAEAATFLAGAAGQAREQTDNVASLMLDLSTARIALRQGETGRATRLAETSLAKARNAQLRDPELQAELLLAESDILSARWASALSRASGAEASWRALSNESSAVIASVYVEAARAGDMNMRSEACGRLDAISCLRTNAICKSRDHACAGFKPVRTEGSQQWERIDCQPGHATPDSIGCLAQYSSSRWFSSRRRRPPLHRIMSRRRRGGRGDQRRRRGSGLSGGARRCTERAPAIFLCRKLVHGQSKRGCARS